MGEMGTNLVWVIGRFEKSRVREIGSNDQGINLLQVLVAWFADGPVPHGPIAPFGSPYFINFSSKLIEYWEIKAKFKAIQNSFGFPLVLWLQTQVTISINRSESRVVHVWRFSPITCIVSYERSHWSIAVLFPYLTFRRPLLWNEKTSSLITRRLVVMDTSQCYFVGEQSIKIKIWKELYG